jgi:hypothetical protein
MKTYFTFSSLDYEQQQTVSSFVSKSKHPYIENHKLFKIDERRKTLIKQYAKRLMFSYGIYCDSTSILTQNANGDNIFLYEAFVINVQKFLNEMFSDLKRNNIEIKSLNPLLSDEEFTNRFIAIRFSNDELIINEKDMSDELTEEDISNLKCDIETWKELDAKEITPEISNILEHFWNFLSTPLYMSDELSQNNFLLFDDDLSPVIPFNRETISI